MVRKLERAPVSMTAPMPKEYLRLRDQVMHTLGIGTTRDMKSVVRGIFVPVWRTPDYSLTERLDVWRGKRFSRGHLWDTFVNADLTKVVTELHIPVYFFHGAHDYTVSYPLAKAYFDQLHAPVKGFYTFGDSAHSPAFEEPEKARWILRDDVMAGRTRLADSA